MQRPDTAEAGEVKPRAKRPGAMAGARVTAIDADAANGLSLPGTALPQRPGAPARHEGVWAKPIPPRLPAADGAGGWRSGVGVKA